jgi:glycosyltransferase involved in cell wall biosynthesis
MRGGEKCVEALCEIFPDATLFALMHKKDSVSPTIERMPIRTSFIQRLPFASEKFRQYLPLFPSAVRRFDLEDFDCVITSHHCVAKGVRTGPGTLHVCYCYTPMRYIWDFYDDYFGPGRTGALTRAGMKLALGPLRSWDLRTARNPHHFVAISENVRRRIKTIYNRESDVIYPPVDTGRFTVSSQDDGFLLVVSALVPYKRVDLALEACALTGDRLVVVGEGPERDRLARMAGPAVELTGWLPDEEVRDLYGRCSAVLFPGEEDFGIVPLEAMATGKPVVAFARGGALETVLETPSLATGVLFAEQSARSLAGAIARVRRRVFDPAGLRSFALTFDRALFKERMREYVFRRYSEFDRDSHKRKS